MQKKWKYQKIFRDNLTQIYSPFFGEHFLHFPNLRLIFCRGIVMLVIAIQMIPHDFCQGVQEEFQWSLVLVFLLFRYLMEYLLDMIRNVMRMLCSLKYEVVFISGGIEYHIALVEYRVPERMALYRGTFYIMVIDIDDMSREYIPIDIHDPEVGYDPHIVIPIKYLVEEIEIEKDRIELEVEERNKWLQREWIVVVEKSRKRQSDEQCNDDTIDDKERVSMAHEKKFFFFPKVFLEKNLIKIIHRQEPLTSISPKERVEKIKICLLYESQYMFFCRECKSRRLKVASYTVHTWMFRIVLSLALWNHFQNVSTKHLNRSYQGFYWAQSRPPAFFAEILRIFSVHLL